MVFIDVCLCVLVYHLLITKSLSVWLHSFLAYICSNSKYLLSGTHLANGRKTPLVYTPPPSPSAHAHSCPLWRLSADDACFLFP